MLFFNFFENAHKTLDNIQNNTRFKLCMFIVLRYTTRVYYFLYYLSNFSTDLYLECGACL
jgi:hypothetical protein